MIVLPLAILLLIAQAPSPAYSQPTAEADFDQFEGEFGEKTAKPAFDPLRGYNRFMFNVNDKFYFWIGKPLSRGYKFILPQPVRVAIGRGFRNLGFPLRFTGSLLQGKFRGAGREVGRFALNSTLGLGGLFDPAEHCAGLKPSDEDLGQTMGFYGVGYGFPVVLPVLGLTSLRDGLGMAPAFLLNPVYYAADTQTFYAVTASGQFNDLSLHGVEYEKIKKEAMDPYTFMRDAHRQHREKKIQE